jgi:nucleotide-binding universal stress UspA family protein
MKRFKNILYVYENSVPQDATIASAVALAKSNQAALTLIDVVPVVSAGIGMPPGGPISSDLQEAVINKHRQSLELLAAPYQKQLNIHIEVLVGKQFLEVIRSVIKNEHDLLIKPAENPDYIERLFGSDDMHILRKCPCPVWLMKSKEVIKHECILAAIDFDPEDEFSEENELNRKIFELAASLSISDSSALHLVHVWDVIAVTLISMWANDPDVTKDDQTEAVRSLHEDQLSQLDDELRKHIGIEAYNYLSPNIHLVRGDAKNVIPAMVESMKVDLVVMGTVARTGIPGFIIGNTAEAILDQLKCSVLAIKPPGFVSPVKLL